MSESNEQNLEPETRRSNKTVFISYSRSDGVFVNDLAKWLREAGCTVWQDTSALRGGQIWANEIDQAIRGSDVFIVVLSPDSSASEWVRKETLLAMKVHKQIVSILLRETEIPVQLIDLTLIDFQGDREAALQKLHETILLSSDSPRSDKNKPFILRLFRQPLALLLLGAIILVAILYLPLSKLGRKSNDNQSASNAAVSTPTGEAPQIFNNWNNEDAMSNLPGTWFKITEPHTIANILNKHGQWDGTTMPSGGIKLRDSDGNVFGPWKVTVGDKPGNWTWECEPKTLIKAGTYEVIDPDPATWSRNGTNRGMSLVRGFPLSSNTRQ